jgi:tight adherence protein B
MEQIQSFLLNGGPYPAVVLITVTAFLLMETVFVTMLGRQRRTGRVNRRLNLLHNRKSNHELTLADLRRERGLSGDGRYILPIIALNRLLTQSGARISAPRLIFLMVLAGIGAGTATLILTGDIVRVVAFAGAAGIVLPIAALMTLRKWRMKAMEEQLPEAIDVMIRSLRAGHPIPVAISMVAREMPDPIGSEFGMAADEMTYGSDLETAMTNLKIRAGQSDLAFLVVALSVQSKTGGNLAEVLTNLSRMVRERFKMRRKVHALSSEGRFSAIALSIVPAAVYLIVTLSAPSYYKDVETDPMFTSAVYLGAILWVTGFVTMKRLVNFKI